MRLVQDRAVGNGSAAPTNMEETRNHCGSERRLETLALHKANGVGEFLQT
jgi:hypothetical protein